MAVVLCGRARRVSCAYARSGRQPLTGRFPMNDKMPVPCEHCHGTGIQGGIECRECGGKGHRVIVAGKLMSQKQTRAPHRPLPLARNLF